MPSSAPICAAKIAMREHGDDRDRNHRVLRSLQPFHRSRIVGVVMPLLAIIGAIVLTEEFLCCLGFGLCCFASLAWGI
jgi:hypothetical protein